MEPQSLSMEILMEPWTLHISLSGSQSSPHKEGGTVAHVNITEDSINETSQKQLKVELDYDFHDLLAVDLLICHCCSTVFQSN